MDEIPAHGCKDTDFGCSARAEITGNKLKYSENKVFSLSPVPLKLLENFVFLLLVYQ
jgi:hypothetical protein